MRFPKKPFHIFLARCLGFGLILMCLLANQVSLALAIKCDWPVWDVFKKYYITDEGRVIDPRDGLNITTSEGQSYGLFFALVANDRTTFEHLLTWTENNLAAGSLAKNLPAWLWGNGPIPSSDSKSSQTPQTIPKEKQKWQIQDPNSAMDADLWIAYSLLEAGRLWNKPDYIKLGRSLLKRVRLEEAVKLSQFGYMLLPGKFGFSHVTESKNDALDNQENINQNSKLNKVQRKEMAEDGASKAPVVNRYWRLNPSYTPPQLLARFRALHPVWKDIMIHNQRMLIEGAPTGLAPDWLIWDENDGFKFDRQRPDTGQSAGSIGSYDAIRVYLWIGMLADDDPNKKILINHYSTILKLMTTDKLNGLPPEKVDVINRSIITDHAGPLGFSAALLPFLQQTPDLLEIQRRRLESQPITADAYYTSVLRLFGQGFDEHYYRFNRQGELLPAWSHKCDNPQ